MKKTNVRVIEQKIEIIDENIYQQYKKEIHKRDDYFSIKEWNNILKYCQK